MLHYREKIIYKIIKMKIKTDENWREPDKARNSKIRGKHKYFTLPVDEEDLDGVNI